MATREAGLVLRGEGHRMHQHHVHHEHHHFQHHDYEALRLQRGIWQLEDGVESREKGMVLLA
jgi:hypothetical protein